MKSFVEAGRAWQGVHTGDVEDGILDSILVMCYGYS